MSNRARKLLSLLILIIPVALLALVLTALAPVPGAAADAVPEGGGVNLTFADRLSGDVHAVAIQDNLAFIGLDEDVVVVDISNLTNPLRRGQFTLTDTVRTVAVIGNYVLAASGGAQLQVINVSDPDAPVDAGTWTAAGAIQSVTVSGEIAYLALGEAGLQLLGIADPNNPQPLGTYPAGMATLRARVSAGYAYLADVDGYVYILDLTNVNEPILVSSYDLGGPVADVNVVAGYAFANWSDCAGINDCQAMFSALDVTQVMTPTHLRTRDLGPGAAATVAVAGGYAYASRYDPSGVNLEPVLTVLDVSVPQFSSIVATFDTPGAYNAYDVVVSGVRALLAGGKAGLQLLSVSDPLNPALQGVVGGPAAPLALGWAGSHLLALSGDGNGEGVLWSLAPSGESLQTAGQAAIPAAAAAVDLAVDGSFAYALGATAGGDGVMVILNVSNPAAPTTLGGLFMDSPLHVAAANGVAVVHDSSGLRVYDVTLPTAPVEVGSYWPGGDLDMAGTLAYVAAGAAGLQILDLSSPDQPALVGSYDPTWLATSLTLSGSLAIVGRSSGGIAVIDVSSPAAPQLVTELPTSWIATSLTMAGSYVLATTGAGGVRVINFVDPARPVVVGTYGTGGLVAVAGGNGRVYAGGLDGLIILLQQYRLAGQVRQANDQPWSGASINFSSGGAAVSGANGNYSVDGKLAGAHTLTPEDGSYAFWPAQILANTPPDGLDLDFTIVGGPVAVTVTNGAGGQLTSLDPQGLATVLDVPPGAVGADTYLVLTPIVLPDEPDYGFAAHGFDLDAYQSGVLVPDFTFDLPVSLTIAYSDPDVAGRNEADLVVLWGDVGSWSDVSGACDPPSAYSRDLEANTLSVPICVTGRMGLFSPRQTVFLPVVIRP